MLSTPAKVVDRNWLQFIKKKKAHLFTGRFAYLWKLKLLQLLMMAQLILEHQKHQQPIIVVHGLPTSLTAHVENMPAMEWSQVSKNEEVFFVSKPKQWAPM